MASARSSEALLDLVTSSQELVPEAERLRLLERTGLLDPRPEPAFDRLTALVCRLLRVPASFISLLDGERRVLKSAQGLEGNDENQDEATLPLAFCQRVVAGGVPLAVEDVRTHPLGGETAGEEAGFAAYLGVPLRAPDGHPVGALCAADRVVRAWTDADREALAYLAELAAVVMTEVAARESVRESEARFRTLFHGVADAILVYPLTDDGPGPFLEVNDVAVERYGYSREEFLRMEPAALLEAGAVDFGAVLDRLRRDGRVLTDSRHVTKDGRVLPTEVAGHLIEFDGRPAVLSVCRDVSERRAAEKDRALLAAIVASSDDAIVSKSLDGIITSWNAGAQRTFGYTAAEVVGKPIFMLIPPERHEEERMILGRLRQGERIDHFETVRMAKDGRRLHISLTVSPIRDGSGRIVGVSKVARDVTPQKEAEAALRASEERFRLASSAIAGVVYDWNLRTGEVHYSSGLRAAVGLDPHAVPPGRAWWLERVHPDDRARLDDALQRAFSGADEAYALEYRIRHEDGTWTDLWDRGYIVRRERGEAARVVGSTTDVTNRKRAERQRDEALAHLDSLLEHAPIGFAFFDREHRYVRVNDELAEINGLPAEDHVGRSIHELLPANAEAVGPALDRVFETGEAVVNLSVTGETPRRPGEERHWLTNVYPVTDAAGHVAWVGVTVAELTEQKRAEAALRERERQQATVAELGHLALSLLADDAASLQALMDRAVVAVAETLGVEMCKVLEVLPGGEHVFLKAGVGWHEGLVGLATVDTGTDSQAGYTLLAGEAVVVEDLRTEARFSGPPLLREHGVVSGMSCIIPGEAGRPWGILGAHTTRRRPFSRDDVHFLEAVANLLAAALQRHHAHVAQLESEARFRALADSAPVLIWMAEPDKSRGYFNAGWLAFTGRAPEDEAGDGWADGVHPDDLKGCVRAYAAAFDAREAFELEYRLRRHDGAYRWVFDRGIPRFDPDGTFLGYIGSCLDIHDRKQAEVRTHFLAEAGSLLDQGLDYEATVQRIAQAAVPAFADWCTVDLVDEDGALRRLVTAHVDPEKVRWAEEIGERYPTDPDAPTGVPNVIRTGEPEFYADIPDDLLVHAAKDEEHLRLLREVGFRSAIVVPLRAGTRVIGAFTFIAARSEQRYAEEDLEVAEELGRRAGSAIEMALLHGALRESEGRFRQLAEALPQIVYTFSPHENDTAYLNPRWYEYTGLPEGTRYGQAMTVVIHPEDAGRVEAAWRRALESQSVLEAELRMRRHDGVYRWFLTRAVPVRDEHGHVVRWFGTSTDIHAHKEMEAELAARVAERTAELERSNAELDQFAYVASHDLKAPLRAIDNLVSWITEDVGDALPPPSKRHLDLLRGRALRMERLLDDLLAYSRAGRDMGGPEPVDVGALVRDVADLLAPPPGFVVEANPGLPTVVSPRAPLETVFRNLIGNAFKHHDGEAGLVRVSAAEATEPGYVAFTVADDGPGIPAEYHERVFGLFQTLRPRDEVEGSGMGLAVVKKAVETRGGAVHIAPGPGRGTAITFTWPREPAPAV